MGRPSPVEVTPPPGYLDHDRQAATARRLARGLRTGAAVHAAHAQIGPGYSSDVELRTARLGFRRKRLPVSTAPSRTARPWPPMPPTLLDIGESSPAPLDPPEARLVNFYVAGAKMGLHQDRDEADFDAPVISISLAMPACFASAATTARADASLPPSSGDAVVLGGPARLAFHGVDRIYPDTSRLLPEGGRINPKRCDGSRAVPPPGQASAPPQRLPMSSNSKFQLWQSPTMHLGRRSFLPRSWPRP